MYNGTKQNIQRILKNFLLLVFHYSDLFEYITRCPCIDIFTFKKNNIMLIGLNDRCK